MRGSTFTFNGINSEEFGIKVIKHDLILPPKRERKLQIPNRHGTYDFGSQIYDERAIQVRCIVERKLSRAELREVAFWLSKKSRLIFFDEPEKYYVGELYSTDIFETFPNEVMREFTLDFICEPFAYGETVVSPIKAGSNAVRYKGTASTPTKIFLRNMSDRSAINLSLTLVKRRGR